jgi:ribonuclease R
MARAEHLNPDDILRFLQLRGSPTRLQEIAKALRLSKDAQRSLYRMLEQLTKRGRIEELPGKRYRLRRQREEQAKQPQSAKPEASQAVQSPAAPASRQAADSTLRAGEVAGRLIVHRDGYGFVVPDHPLPNLAGDIFIPRDAIEDAMHGDRVAVQLAGVRFSPRGAPAAEGQRREGRIVRVLQRANPTVVGLFRYGVRGNVVLPYDSHLQHEIEIPPGDELAPELRQKLGAAAVRAPRLRVPELDGAVVNVELRRYPKGGLAPSGRVVEILGRPGDLGVDIEIIIRKHHLPHEFSPEVLEEAERAARPVSQSEAEAGGREDFRRLPIVTIDGETARDFDDAVYVERLPAGWRLQVHIADVSHYVRTGAALDKEARLRGTSVYFPDRAVPMLPEALSNGICSLNPREERLVLSALMEFDARGNVRSARMTPGVIHSAERMTYTSVNKVLEGDPEATARYSALAQHFRDMKDLALLLNARRNEHGSIDFDLPERVIEFDEEQRMITITRSERNIAHRIIEEFMLAANRAVDAYLLRRGIAALHRVHEKPDARKVLEFEELAHAFGYSLGVENLHQREIAVRHGRVPSPSRAGRPESRGHGRDRPMTAVLPGADNLRVTPQHYQRLVRKIAGKPEERILAYLMLRSLKQARYSAEPLGHFALGFSEYTHFTSPIRRYPDLIVHRILKWALEHPNQQPGPEAHPARGAEAAIYSAKQLEDLAGETSEAERRAAAAERELLDWKTAQFMEAHLGDEYDALIISVQKFGFFVELFEVFVEGLVPIGALEEAAGARCVFRERDHAIVAMQPSRGSRSSRGHAAQKGEWHLGDRVRVRAERIDPMRHRVEFAIVDDSPAKPAR